MNFNRPFRLAAASCVAVCILTTLGFTQDVTGGRWPWGTPVSATGKPADVPGFDALDLWNLGMLGAKAGDARVRPRSTGVAGVLRATGDGPAKSISDLGPPRLRIDALFPGGPAQRSDLRLGDVVTAVDGVTLENGSQAPLASALRRAAAAPAGQGRIMLTVERPGAPARLDIMVSVPSDGETREQIAGRALEWLLSRQQADGGFPETLSGMNGAVVQAGLAGLAWVAGGSTPAGGRHAAAVRKSLDFVTRNVSASDALGSGADGRNWNQNHWGYVHAALFLGELHARSASGRVRSELQRYADVITRNQARSGGWGHGPGGRNALGYVELNILTGLALNALGLAKQAGCAVDDAAVRHAAEYLESSSGPDGGVGYSTEPGQKGIGNIGRSSAAWLGFANLGLTDRPLAGRIRTYVSRHAGEILGGHASLMQQVLLAGVASQAIGGEAELRFWEAAEAEILLALTPDGSLQPRPWHESLAMGVNADVATGQVWTTASWAIVLLAKPSADHAGLPALCGRLVPTAAHWRIPD